MIDRIPRWSRCRLALALAAGLAWAPAAWAQPADDASRSVARGLGQEGIALLDRGEYAAALEKFDRALALVPVPTLGVRAGRCLEKLGHWVEAAERYRLVGGMTVDPASPAAFRAKQLEAQVEASRERAALVPRIPTVHVVLEGRAASEIALQIDGRVVPSAVVDARVPVDPGAHRFEAVSGEQRAVAELSLSEGEGKDAVLRFDPRPAPVFVPTAPPPRSAPTPPAPPPATAPASHTRPEPERRTSPRRTAGFIAVGVGAGALTAGVVAWGVALGKSSDLDAACGPDGTCPRALAGDLDSYDAWKAASTVLLVAGAVIGASGAALVLTAPPARQAGPRTAVLFAPAGVRVSRDF